jgi:hypothetical protein
MLYASKEELKTDKIILVKIFLGGVAAQKNLNRPFLMWFVLRQTPRPKTTQKIFF